MLRIVNSYTGIEVSKNEYNFLVKRAKNNHLYDLKRLCAKKNLNVSVYIKKFVVKVSIQLDNGVTIFGETFSIDNNKIHIYNF